MNNPQKNTYIAILVTVFIFTFGKVEASSIFFVYPYYNQIVAPGDRMAVSIRGDLGFANTSLPLDFMLIPTMHAAPEVKDILMASIKAATTTFYFDVPSDILAKTRNVRDFQIGAIRNGTGEAFSEIFHIVSGVPTSTVLIGTSTAYAPKCVVDRMVVAPNDKVVFTPSSSKSDVAFYRWIGEASTTSKGAIPLSFIYPGKYTITLESTSVSGAIYQASCPTVIVAFDATPSKTPTTTPAFYPFPFNNANTKALIPKEIVDYATLPNCLNLGQDLKAGYSDDVKSPKTGVIYKLQKFLKAFGYLKANPSGFFGPMTKSAVKAFQDANGILPSGLVGPDTRTKIKDVSCTINNDASHSL